MSGRRKHDRCRSRSPDHPKDEDADFQLALKMSAELNGDQAGYAETVATAAKQQANIETDFDIALRMHMQFNDEAVTKADDQVPSYFTDASALLLATPHQRPTYKTTARIFETETSAENTFLSLSNFQDHLKRSKCSRCGDRFFEHESDVIKLFREWYEGRSGLSSLLHCKTCCMSSCIACPAAAGSKRSKVTAGNLLVSWCCNSSRVMLIWLLLCGFDTSYCETKVNVREAVVVGKKNAEPPATVEDKGKGKGKTGKATQRKGIGYGGNESYLDYTSSLGFDDFDKDLYAFGDNEEIAKLLTKRSSRLNAKGPGRTISDEKSRIFEAQQAMDMLATAICGILQHLLPSLARNHSFDLNPPAMITDVLLQSKILHYSAELLRNHSLDDAFTRKATYYALLDFVQVVGTHPAMANLTVLSGRPQQADLCTLLTQAYRSTGGRPEGTVPSIADSLRGLNNLSNSLLKNAEHHKTIYSSESDKELLRLCRKISELWKNISTHKSAPELGADLSTTIDVISEVNDSRICASHAFATMAKAQIRSAPGRFKRLVSEISVLKTSLPPNIFVRHGESRLDVMKCAIIGPEDTPYENGIFEFDFYCPAEYPNVPPFVSFKGTGGGIHAVNPNLYADGKVCLSLLGTWSGEPWKPGESTLLQVLVSLQAMVFCEQPWYNEPGREQSHGSNSASDAYNRRLRELTVRLAMLSWLEKPPQIWEEVVEQHFKSNADKILHTVIDWGKKFTPSDSGTVSPEMPDFLQDLHARHSESGYSAILPELHKHLQKYGATVLLPALPKEIVEPQSKKPRVEGSQLGDSRTLAPQTAPGPYSWAHGPEHHIAPSFFDDEEGMDDYEHTFGIGETLRGGHRGRSKHDLGYSFRGRGQILGAGLGIHPPASSDGTERGRGRGRGRGFSDWLGRGGALSGLLGIPSPGHESHHGNGKRGDGGSKLEDGGRGGRGGRGGHCGSGSSKASEP